LKQKLLNQFKFMSKEKKVQDSSTPEEKELYHFPGGAEFKPKSIKANSYEEALAIWEKEKEPLTN